MVEVLTESKDLKQYLEKMLCRDEQLKNKWGTICTIVEMVDLDERRRKIQLINYGRFKEIVPISNNIGVNR